MLNKNLSDTELVAAVVKNDEKAFAHLFERHWACVYATAFYYIKDGEMSLEITHDIFMNIWERRHQLHINSFKSYVITAASYHGLRKRQCLRAIPIDYVENSIMCELPSGMVRVVNEGETRIEQHELLTKVDKLLDQLPKRCREIYIMSRNENLTITEIAERLEISKRTVENQLTAALKYLRGALVLFLLTIFNK